MRNARVVHGLITTAIMLMADHGRAFDSDEHMLMGNAAIVGAIGYLKATGNGSSPGLKTAMLLEKQYGAINKCVDFFLYPEKILAFAIKHGDDNASPTIVPDEYHRIPEQLIKSCNNPNFSYLQATHNNHAHFQQDLIVSLRLYHATAIGLAQSEENLYGALIVNAIADHYLQDLFAPGHLVTARDSLTDLPATAQHDLANRMGAIFRPDARDLGEVLDFLCGISPRKLETRDGTEACVVDENNRPAFQFFKPIQEMSKRIADIRMQKPILFRGDGELNQESQQTQRLFLLAVQIRSILDVIEAADKTIPNHRNLMKKISFKNIPSRGQPIVKTAFGDYEFHLYNEPISKILAATSAPTIVNESSDSSNGNSTYTFTACSLGGCSNKLYEPRSRSPVIGLSYQRESQSSGEHQSRNVVTGEISAFGTNFDLRQLSKAWVSSIEVAPLIGYSYYTQGRFSGSGPTFRAPFLIPETEFSFGPYVRWLRYSADGASSARKWSYGLRMDSGFSTFATFYLGYGVDSEPGSLNRTRVWTAGVRLGTPLSRLEFWR